MRKGTGKQKYIIGIDEVGRGSLAGPVVVAAAAIPHNFKFSRFEISVPLRDSKKLTKRAREAWVSCLSMQGDVHVAFGYVSPRVVDRINITRAANRAATKAYMNLTAKRGWLIAKGARQTANRTQIFLDGGLYLEKRAGAPHAKTVIRGDEKIKAVAVASIFAKVSRDNEMRRLARKYPGYGFETHKGYGTEIHRRAVKKLGTSKAHRLSFLGNVLKKK
ncbi:MAG: ribonuclease HII [Patescibacteria group bacterium]